MSKILSCIGILCTVIGTVLTLWTTFSLKSNYVGTWKELAERKQNFPKEKCRVILGCIIILIGGLLQITGQLL